MAAWPKAAASAAAAGGPRPPDARLAAAASGQRFLHDEKPRRQEDQVGHQEVERRFAGAHQQHRAEDAAQETGNRQEEDLAGMIAQFRAVAPKTAQGPRPQGDGIGGVGNDGRLADEDQGGEGQKRAAARHRVDGPAQDGREKQDQQVKPMHLWAAAISED